MVVAFPIITGAVVARAIIAGVVITVSVVSRAIIAGAVVAISVIARAIITRTVITILVIALSIVLLGLLSDDRLVVLRRCALPGVLTGTRVVFGSFVHLHRSGGRGRTGRSRYSSGRARCCGGGLPGLGGLPSPIGFLVALELGLDIGRVRGNLPNGCQIRVVSLDVSKPQNLNILGAGNRGLLVGTTRLGGRPAASAVLLHLDRAISILGGFVDTTRIKSVDVESPAIIALLIEAAAIIALAIIAVGIEPLGVETGSIEAIHVITLTIKAIPAIAVFIVPELAISIPFPTRSGHLRRRNRWSNHKLRNFAPLSPTNIRELRVLLHRIGRVVVPAPRKH
jgi:hypothetical protein